MKHVAILLLAAAFASAQAPYWTINLTTTPWSQNNQSPAFGPLNVGGEMAATCYDHIPGNQHQPPQTIQSTINTAYSGPHVIDIGVLEPGGARGPCHVPASFDAHGSEAVRVAGVNYNVYGVESGVFTMSWTYEGVYYQVVNYIYLYCDNYYVNASVPFTYPC